MCNCLPTNIKLVSDFFGISEDELMSVEGDNDWFFWCGYREFEVVDGIVCEV